MSVLCSMCLRRYEEARADLQRVLSLEKNRQAQADLEKVQQILKPAPKPDVTQLEVTEDTGMVQAIYKAPEQRSQKPLRRVPITEVGVEVAEPAAPAAKHPQLLREQQHLDRLLSQPAAPQPAVTLPRAVTSPRSVTSPGSPQLPEPPSTSYQFESDFKALRNHDRTFYEYFKRVPPTSYAQIFGQCLEADVLNRICHILKTYYISNGDDVLPVLHHLTEVKRFALTVMFMSPTDKKVVAGLLETVSEEDERKRLQKLYCIEK